MDCFEKCIEDSDKYIERINYVLENYMNENIASDLRTEILKELQIQNFY